MPRLLQSELVSARLSRTNHRCDGGPVREFRPKYNAIVRDSCRVRLLILKCSSSKRGPDELVPAIERYDGPLWQVLRAYLRKQGLWSSDLDIYGLSAEFGLIPAQRAIPLYERTMDSGRAYELNPQVLATFQTLMERQYDQLCLGVSQRYLAALAGWEAHVPSTTVVTTTDGTAAIKLGQLRAWLHGEPWRGIAPRPPHLKAEATPRGIVRIGGVTLRMSREEAIAQARASLAEDATQARQANRYRYWYAMIDGQPVGVKWLASVLSGLPTTAFQAAQARQALLALGIDVESVSV